MAKYVLSIGARLKLLQVAVRYTDIRMIDELIYLGLVGITEEDLSCLYSDVGLSGGEDVAETIDRLDKIKAQYVQI